VASWFDATREEQAELVSALAIAREAILSRHRPGGFNFGVNIGEMGGQTVPHLHVHLIPRYGGDVRDPRGGIRHVLPARANYLESNDRRRPRFDRSSTTSYGPTLVTGENDPLLPYLKRHSMRPKADFLAAFVLERGRPSRGHLEDLLDCGRRVRILTGDTSASPTRMPFCLRSQGERKALDACIRSPRNELIQGVLFHGPSPIATSGAPT
jgi:hypothetical protein